MRKLVWLESAIEDLVRLREFIAKENPRAAREAAAAIQTAVSRLSELPWLGKPVLNLLPYRDLPVRFGAGGYIVRYRVLEAGEIFLVHLRHYREKGFHSIVAREEIYEDA